jgi:hypothetical protein
VTNPVDYLPPQFERLIAALNRRKVAYIVIGGVAAVLQGWPLMRTLDLDITPAADLENKLLLSEALRDVDAKLRAEGLDEGVDIRLDERTFTGIVTMTFVTKFGPFDVCFVPDGTTGYDDLARNAKEVDVDGVRFRVASVEDIKRSKMAAGREKDARHLRLLGRAED